MKPEDRGPTTGPPFRLRPQKGRLLVPVGVPCPFGCPYCYTDFEGFHTPAWSHAEILSEVRRLLPRHRIRTFQVGYDGDPVTSWARAGPLLEDLARLDAANLNIQTKAVPDGEQLDALARLARRLAERGRIFSVLVTITSWDSAPRLEPGAPAPAERTATIARLRDLGVPTLVALRPMIPGVPKDELERVLEAAGAVEARGPLGGPRRSQAQVPLVDVEGTLLPAEVEQHVAERPVELGLVGQHRRLGKPVDRRRVILFNTVTEPVRLAHIVGCCWVLTRGGFGKPFEGLSIVTLYALSKVIELREPILRLDMPRLRRRQPFVECRALVEGLVVAHPGLEIRPRDLAE